MAKKQLNVNVNQSFLQTVDNRVMLKDTRILIIANVPAHLPGGLEFSSYEIKLQNRVTQNDVTFRVTNSEIFTEILLSSY